jgi:VanZ family protein
VVLVLSLAAVILELSQLVIPHRDANLLDVLVSVGGAIIGAGIARVFAYVWRQYLH